MQPIILFFFQAEDGIRDVAVTGVQTCALPICGWNVGWNGEGVAAGPEDRRAARRRPRTGDDGQRTHREGRRSEEHTSELQSRLHLVCRLLLEKKKRK